MKRVCMLTGMILLACSLFAKEFICNTDKPYVRTMTIDSSGKDSLPSTIEANCFYKMDFAPFADGEKKSSLCKVDVFNERGKISRTEMIVADDNGHFVSKIYLPYESTKMTLSLKNDAASEFEEYKSFELVPLEMTETPVVSKDKKSGITKVTVDHTNLHSVPKTLETGSVYLFDVYLEEFDFDKYTLVPRIQGADVFKNEMVRQINGHYAGTVLASQNTLSISLESSVAAVARLDTLFFCKIENNGKNVQLAAGKDFRKADKYRRMAADERLISFLEGVNARQVCTRDPDAVLELCVKKITELAHDDFEKVFLIHDAIWYLVSYDNLSYKILDPTNQDYVSNLKRGVCVCEGFAKLFSQMCLLMDIPACDVYGWGVSQTDNGQEQGGLHAWNIVMVQNKWYTIDVTWDCSHFENGKRDDMYSTVYIFQKPKEFVKMHHPSSPEFQLLKKPLKFGSVENIVKYQGV